MATYNTITYVGMKGREDEKRRGGIVEALENSEIFEESRPGITPVFHGREYIPRNGRQELALSNT
jgi:hypothetical protein